MSIRIANAAVRTKMGSKSIFDKFPDNVALGGVWTKGEEFEESKHDQGVEICWSIKGKGFGTIAIYKKKGKLMLDTENESKDFVKKILCALVDKATIND